MADIFNRLSDDLPTWLCVLMLFLVIVQIERLGRAISGLHKILFAAHESEIEETIRRRIEDGRRDG